MLVDRYSRIVAVEIEPEVTATDEAGPLQAIKYRYMLEWSANRALGDSRALLIAHKIDSVIREKCRDCSTTTGPRVNLGYSGTIWRA